MCERAVRSHIYFDLNFVRNRASGSCRNWNAKSAIVALKTTATVQSPLYRAGKRRQGPARAEREETLRIQTAKSPRKGKTALSVFLFIAFSQKSQWLFFRFFHVMYSCNIMYFSHSQVSFESPVCFIYKSLGWHTFLKIVFPKKLTSNRPSSTTWIEWWETHNNDNTKGET